MTETVYLKDYTVPIFLIEKVDLEFDLNESFTLVTSTLTLYGNLDSGTIAKDLILHGEELELVSIALNQKPLSANEYQQDAKTLTIFNVPDRFTLTIQTRIHPESNTSLSGLYKSSGNFCTQCEAEG